MRRSREAAFRAEIGRRPLQSPLLYAVLVSAEREMYGIVNILGR
jgi:hypothetical protein